MRLNIARADSQLALNHGSCIKWLDTTSNKQSTRGHYFLSYKTIFLFMFYSPFSLYSLDFLGGTLVKNFKNFQNIIFADLK